VAVKKTALYLPDIKPSLPNPQQTALLTELPQPTQHKSVPVCFTLHAMGLTENTLRHYKIYSILLPVCMVTMAVDVMYSIAAEILMRSEFCC
jgi:hypothetical protein